MRTLTSICILLTGLALPTTASAQATLYKIHGEVGSSWLGSLVAGVGDLNNDGAGDFAVGIPGDDTAGSNFGAVQVHSGIDGTILFTIYGDSSSRALGGAVSAGDYNNDGTLDLVSGNSLDDTNGSNAGIAQVWSGVDGAWIATFYGDDAGDGFGGGVSGAGDYNNDGFDDIIVGASGDDDGANNGGSARVLSGFDESILRTFYESTFQGGMGKAVGRAGNVNGDVYDDVIVGSTHAGPSNNGRAYVFPGNGGATIHTFLGAAFDQLGGAVAGVGDVNGDGRDDVLIGSILADPNGDATGTATAFSGLDGSVLHVIEGDAQTQYLGWSVAGTADFDGDGIPDLIAGTPEDSTIGTDAGMVKIVSGGDYQVLQTYYGLSSFDDFGHSVAGVGDLNGDGRSEVLVGAPRADEGGFANGTATLFVGLARGCSNVIGSIDRTFNGVPDICEFCQANLTAPAPGNLHLQVCGDDLTQAGSQADLVISNGSPLELVFLLFSLNKTPTPAFGGVIYPLPAPTLYAFALDEEGLLRLELNGGDVNPVNVYAQAIAPWPGGGSTYEISGATVIAIGQ